MIKKIALSVAIGALVLTLVPVALAGKGTGGKGKPGGGRTVAARRGHPQPRAPQLDGRPAHWAET